MPRRCAGLIGVLLAGVAFATSAQSSSRPAASTVEGVTVKGGQPKLEVSPDGRSYDVSTNLQAATGSVADLLRNIPSVAVDPQGEVSLRGDSDVTILIDGKAAGQFKGEARGAALQAMPASRIARVEVLTNPSAARTPEGSAGVINLITKKSNKPGASGSLQANVGDRNAYNATLAAAFNSKRLAVNADLSVRRDPSLFSAVETRRGAGGDMFSSADHSRLRGHGTYQEAHLTADYDLDAHDRLSGELRRARQRARQFGDETFAGVNAAGNDQAFERLIFPSPYVWNQSKSLRRSVAPSRERIMN